MEFFTPQTVAEKRKTVISAPYKSTIFPGIEYRDLYRAYSPKDSLLWLDLFVKAHERYGVELCSILMFVRGTGALLIKSPQWNYIIQPVIGGNGFRDQAEYDKEKVCMGKYRAEIIELLRGLK